jgi:hypothetical protein
VHDAYAALALAAHDRSASAFGAASGAVRLTEARLAWAVTAVPQPVTP